MSRWDDATTRTSQEATAFWAGASMDVLFGMMEPRWAWEAWLTVACGVITEPGSVFEPGCGIGLLAGLLPSGCTYYGCDVNEEYVATAQASSSVPNARFECRDIEDVLSAGVRFDWVVVTSLFGMFPEDESYHMIERLWACARKGMSVTTMDKSLVWRSRRLRFDFTAHDPDELLAAGRALPGAGRVELHRGREYPEFRGHHRQRGLALFTWRT